jgi:hypothetical protein
VQELTGPEPWGRALGPQRHRVDVFAVMDDLFHLAIEFLRYSHAFTETSLQSFENSLAHTLAAKTKCLCQRERRWKLSPKFMHARHA